MIETLEDVMLGLFAAAILVWLFQIRNAEKSFHRAEKLGSVMCVVAFLLGTFMDITKCNVVGAALCLIGFVASEFTVAITFYDDLKEKEIAHE